MRNKEKELTIKNWIYPHKQINFKLLFRMSRDGKTAINFHSKCDFKGKTLILIETTDGKRIGGYSMHEWGTEDRKKYGEYIWLFNLEKNIWKYSLMKGMNYCGIICKFDNGPSFENGIIFENNDLSVGYIEAEPLMKIAEIKDKKIKVKEMEVFQVFIKY